MLTHSNDVYHRFVQTMLSNCFWLHISNWISAYQFASEILIFLSDIKINGPNWRVSNTWQYNNESDNNWKKSKESSKRFFRLLGRHGWLKSLHRFTMTARMELFFVENCKIELNKSTKWCLVRTVVKRALERVKHSTPPHYLECVSSAIVC